jgi:hypothetical protein
MAEESDRFGLRWEIQIRTLPRAERRFLASRRAGRMVGMRQTTLHLIQSLREFTKTLAEPSGDTDVVQHAACSRKEIADQLRQMRRQFGRKFAKDGVTSVARRSWGVVTDFERPPLRAC